MPDPELDEQLNWAPPELLDADDSVPCELANTALVEDVLGPADPPNEPAAIPELVEALELVEQLPELPLTLDGEFVCCVFEELLQLYAFATLGVWGIIIKKILTAQMEIAIVIAILFICEITRSPV